MPMTTQPSTWISVGEFLKTYAPIPAWLGLVTTISTIVLLWDKFINRKPRLDIDTYSCGIIGDSTGAMSFSQLTFFCFRVVNHSRQDAYVHFETVKVFYKEKWAWRYKEIEIGNKINKLDSDYATLDENAIWYILKGHAEFTRDKPQSFAVYSVNQVETSKIYKIKVTFTDIHHNSFRKICRLPDKDHRLFAVYTSNTCGEVIINVRKLES
jgi:hypothetical protein